MNDIIELFLDNHDVVSVKFYELESQLTKDQTDYSQVQPSASIFSPPRGISLTISTRMSYIAGNWLLMRCIFAVIPVVC